MVATIVSSLRTSPSLTLLLGLLLGALHSAVAEPTNFYRSVSVPSCHLGFLLTGIFFCGVACRDPTFTLRSSTLNTAIPADSAPAISSLHLTRTRTQVPISSTTQG